MGPELGDGKNANEDLPAARADIYLLTTLRAGECQQDLGVGRRVGGRSLGTVVVDALSETLLITVGVDHLHGGVIELVNSDVHPLIS